MSETTQRPSLHIETGSTISTALPEDGPQKNDHPYDDDDQINKDLAPPKTPRSLSNKSMFYAAGFFLCMIVMELALEGANRAFPDLVALPYAVTLFQFAFCFLLPLFLSRGKSLSSFPKTLTECIPYVSLSLVVFGSTCFASMSVRYVGYPTKVVFKSTKLIPTMIVATLLQRGTQYNTLDYLAAAVLCAGAAGYGWKSGADNEENTMIGVTLLLVSVFCDAFTPNIQQRLMAPPTMLPVVKENVASPPSVYTMERAQLSCFCDLFLPSGGGGLGLSASELMTNANGIGCIGLLFFMTFSGHLDDAMGVAFEYPFLLIYLVIVGLALATAVLCYTRVIRESGSVLAVAVATLRKVATVVLSYIVYPKTITMIHVISGLLVFSGIVISSYAKQRAIVSEKR